jgi:lysophospholipase L1-like esterase
MRRLIVLGDSFAEGWGDPRPEGGLRGWVPRFASAMDLAPHAVLNLGKYGSTTQHVIDKQLPVALNDTAPLVVAYVGVNDLLHNYDHFDAPRFAENLRFIYSSLVGPGTTVVTATYPDIPGNLELTDIVRRRLRNRFAEGSRIVEELADEIGVFCIDAHRPPEWREPVMWSSDRLHPGPLGHQYFVHELMSLTAASGLVVAS